MTRAYNTATTQQNSGGAVAGVTAGKNAFINGAFDIWQRGTSINASASGTPYAADRWTIFSGNTGTVTRQATGDTTNLPNIQYCARVQRTAGGTGTGAFYFGQSIETINSIPFAGKTIAYSFYARAGANFSGYLTGNFLASTGTDQNYVTGTITGQTTVISTGNIPLTTTWQRFTFTGTVPTNATQIGQFFYSTATGTAGAADYYEITGVQLEVGSVATPFSRAGGTIQGELAACQRYYQKSFDQGTTPANGTSANGQVYYNRQAASGSIEPTVWVKLSPTMRTAPTVALYNPYLASPGGQWSDGSISSANARTINLSDSGFTIDNTDVTYSTTNFAIQYSASSEL